MDKPSPSPDAAGHTRPIAEPRPGAIARESIIRLTADGASLAAGLVASIFIARVLGPVAKGDYATIIYLVGLLAAISTLGLGDANIILVSRNAFRLTEATRYSSTLVLGVATLIATPAILGAVLLLFRDSLSTAYSVAGWAVAAVVTTALSNLANTTLLAKQRVTLTSVALIVSSWITAAFIALALGVFDGGVPEAILASVVGAVVAMTIAGGGLVREGWRPRLGWSRAYAGQGLKLGFPLQAASVLMLMSARVDLLLVHTFLGSGSAGQYSVSLMFGQLVLYAPVALSLVVFPRVARATLGESRALATAAFRASLIASLAAAVILGGAAAFLIPLVFGSEFMPAVLPAVLLVVGGVLWSEQWALARAEAARGTPSLLFVSSGWGVVTMVLLDALLIPAWGLTGAALASDVAALVAVIVCVTKMRRGDWGLGWSDLVPKREDLARLTSVVRR